MPQDIYIVEDHPVMRQGYVALVEAERDLQACGEAESAPKARKEIPEIEPDLTIMDLSLRKGSGLELTKDLRELCPETRVLVVSVHDEALYAERALQAGAAGYLTKGEPAEKIVEAIHRILEGGMFFENEIKNQLLLRLGLGDGGGASPLLADLSDRELEVFEQMGRGLTTDEIGQALNLSPKTVGTYRRRAKEKLGIDSNAALRRRAVVWLELSES